MTLLQILLLCMFGTILLLQIRILSNRRVQQVRMIEESYNLNEELIGLACDCSSDYMDGADRCHSIGLVAQVTALWRKRYLRSHAIPETLERKVYERMFHYDA